VALCVFHQVARNLNALDVGADFTDGGAQIRTPSHGTAEPEFWALVARDGRNEIAETREP
jgi:hypothetical protein